MNDLSSHPGPLPEPSPQDLLSALFADLVVHQSNLALMFLGQTPLPQTKERTVDLDAAQMFIDQLEMLEVKTRGNLTKAEEQLLKQSLTQLRMIFVQVSERGPETAPGSKGAPPPSPETPPPTGAVSGVPSAGPSPAVAEDDSKVKFSKKY
jgi:hypothetical protein